MRLILALPRLLSNMAEARVEMIHLAAGDCLAVGSKIIDVTVDLGSGFQQDCPPISHYRFVSRETARLASIEVGVGGICAPGEVVAVFESAEGDGERPLRTSIAGIVSHPSMWSMRVNR